jgi:hypothetical protein
LKLWKNRAIRCTLAGLYPRPDPDSIGQHQQGAYKGRESEWERQEADIIAAGREGRVVGGPYLTK